MQDNRQFIEDGNQFRLYIEDKYQGREVVSPVTGESRIVHDITDVLWENLDIGDQKLALKPEISWALGFGNAKTIEKSTDIRRQRNIKLTYLHRVRVIILLSYLNYYRLSILSIQDQDQISSQYYLISPS